MKNQNLKEFEVLNGHIIDSINAKDYARAVLLDKARREVLRDLCLEEESAMDDSFFSFIESCAAQNANLIKTIQEDMHKLAWQTNNFTKARRAYNV
jgi:hypothetical protein